MYNQVYKDIVIRKKPRVGGTCSQNRNPNREKWKFLEITFLD